VDKHTTLTRALWCPSLTLNQDYVLEDVMVPKLNIQEPFVKNKINTSVQRVDFGQQNTWHWD
jgi:hypothetical protein